MKYFVSAIVAVVGIAVGISLYVVGSPQGARLRRFDDLRVQNLQMIQDQVFSYWVSEKSIPARLSDLNDETRQVRIPKDPLTGESYTYEKKSSEQFVLCANFALSNDREDAKNGYRDPYYYPSYSGYPYLGELTWEHEAGMQCFTRTIDKASYQKNNNL